MKNSLCLVALCLIVSLMALAHAEQVTDPGSRIETGGSTDSIGLASEKSPPPVATVGESRAFGLSLLLLGGSLLVLALPILLIVALFLIPIPALVLPRELLPLTNNSVLVTGKALKDMGIMDLLSENANSFRGILESDGCVQRISCEILRASKNANLEKLVQGIMKDMPMNDNLKWQITRAAQSGRNCRRFQCDPLSSVRNIFSQSTRNKL